MIDKKNFGKNELVVFIGKMPDGEIYSVEIGKIKRLCSDGAFVYYHTGDTVSKTSYDNLYKLENNFVIEKERLGEASKDEYSN